MNTSHMTFPRDQRVTQQRGWVSACSISGRSHHAVNGYEGSETAESAQGKVACTHLNDSRTIAIRVSIREARVFATV